MKRKIVSFLHTAVPLGLLAALSLSSDAAAKGCLDALRVCGRLIIPSLFPFFVLSSCLAATGVPAALGRLLAPWAARLYGVSGDGATALLIGLTGGYPAGAVYIRQLEQSGCIDAGEGERLLGFCNNSGPAFLIGAIGSGVFHSVRAGLILYAAHAFAALIAGLFFRGTLRPRPVIGAAAPLPFASALNQAVTNSVSAILRVCGFVLLFSALLAVLDSGGALSLLGGFLAERLGWGLPVSRALLRGFFELGSGVAAMEGLLPTPRTLGLSAFLVGWGGVSVCFQTLSVLDGSKLKGALLVTGRLMSAGIGGILAWLFGSLLL